MAAAEGDRLAGEARPSRGAIARLPVARLPVSKESDRFGSDRFANRLRAIRARLKGIVMTGTVYEV